MSDDIVTRLRATGIVEPPLVTPEHAADEIERLRDQCDTMRDLVSRVIADRTQYAMRVQALEAEVTRLERLAANGNT